MTKEEFSTRTNAATAKQRDYIAAHSRCPACGKACGQPVVAAAGIRFDTDMAAHRNTRPAACDCGWGGTIHELKPNG